MVMTHRLKGCHLWGQGEMLPYLNLFHWARLVILTLLLAACAGNATGPYPYFYTVEIDSSSTQPEISKALTRAELAAIATTSNTSKGAALGVGVSLICGPMFVACAGLMVPVFAGPQLIVGPLYGLAGFSREDADRVNAHFESLSTGRDLNKELLIAVTALIPSERLATTGGDARLNVGIKTIVIYQGSNSEFNSELLLKLTAVGTLEWTRGREKPHNTERNFECETEKHEVKAWLADSGHSLDEAIDLCLDVLAKQVNDALTGNPPPSEA